MRFLLATLLTIWAVSVTREAMGKWERRRRRIACAICLDELRPAGSGENASGPWFCGRCGLVVVEVRALYAKLERRAS